MFQPLIKLLGILDLTASAIAQPGPGSKCNISSRFYISKTVRKKENERKVDNASF